MNFSLSSSTSSSYSIGNDSIKPVNKQRDLGITITNNLSWSSHIKDICSKAYRSLFLVKRTIAITSPSHIKKSLYLSLVRSQLSYCSQLWRPRLIKDIILLENIQGRASKYILNNFVIDYKSLLILLNVLPLMYHLELLDLLFVLKCLKDPPDNFDIFNYISYSFGPTRSSTSH